MFSFFFLSQKLKRTLITTSLIISSLLRSHHLANQMIFDLGYFIFFFVIISICILISHFFGLIQVMHEFASEYNSQYIIDEKKD